MTYKAPSLDEVIRLGADLRSAIANRIAVEQRARMLPKLVGDQFGVWAICGGCGQSATGSYFQRLCCTRCQAVVW